MGSYSGSGNVSEQDNNYYIKSINLWEMTLVFIIHLNFIIF